MIARAWCLAIVSFASGCLQPVVGEPPLVMPAIPAVTRCLGDCPSGECDDACGTLPSDGGCADPQQCILRLACERKMLGVCSAYDGGVERPERQCGPASFVFCMTTTTERFATDCRFGKAITTSCRSTCDGGTVDPTCREICGAQYCVE
ncbi:MAG: hypothetical protein QM817_22620 [Archangium sp.]